MKQKLYHENELPMNLPLKVVAELLWISLSFCYELFRSDEFPRFRAASCLSGWTSSRDATRATLSGRCKMRINLYSLCVFCRHYYTVGRLGKTVNATC